MVRGPRYGVYPRWIAALAAASIACGTDVRVGRIPGDGGGEQGAVTGVAVGLTHHCVIRDGALLCEGYSLHGELIGPIAMRPVDGVAGAVEVAAGHSFTCVRHGDGGVSCVGANQYGQLGRGVADDHSLAVERIEGLSARSIAAGVDTMCAQTDDDRLLCWGRNDFGQVAPSSIEPVIRAPVELAGISARQVSLGSAHTCVVTAAGGVLCFGRNADGELGDGTGADLRGPVEVRGLGSGVSRVQCSNNPYQPGASCALRTDGTIACWGHPSDGVIGDGTGDTAFAPVEVAGVAGAGALWLGGKTVLARSGGGTVVWGHPGALVGVVDRDALAWLSPAPLPALDRFDALAVNLSTACGLDAGQVYCWGINDAEQFAGAAPGAIVPITELSLP